MTGADAPISEWGRPDEAAAGVDESWPSDAPAVVASVSRLSAPPPSAIGAVRPLTERMPVAAAVQTVGSPGYRPVDLPTVVQRLPGVPSPGQFPADVPEVGQLGSRAAEAAEAASTATSGAATSATDTVRDTADVVRTSAQALSPAAPAAPGAAPENVEQLVRKLYGPLIRRIKAELLLDRERRGIRIDGI